MDKKTVSSGYLAVSKEDKANYYGSDAYLSQNATLLKQAFSGEVTDKEETFPKGLGAEHPFDFDMTEKTYKQVGLVNGAVNAYTDAIMGDFNVLAVDPNVQTILDSFIEDSNFTTALRAWVNEGIYKGNGFMELDLKESKIRVMNANSMYVRRNKKGKVLGYNQFKGKSSTFTGKDDKKVIPFSADQIAHLLLNKIPNDAYGIGYLWPSMVSVNNYAGAEMDNHKLLSRKAGAPLHVAVGVEGEAVDPTAIDEFKDSLQYMNNRTEWVTDANTKMSTIDFSGIGDNLFDLSNHDIEQVAYGMGIPLVMLGKANVPEGLAKAQKEKFNKTIGSIRTIIENVVEERIFRVLLREQGLDAKIEFKWDLPTTEDTNNKIQRLTELVKNPFIAPELKAAIELDLAETLGYEEAMDILDDPKEARKQAEEEEAKEDAIRKEEEEEIKQPEVPGVKPTARESAKVEVKETAQKVLTESQAREMTLAQYVNITELAGFNYTDYLIKILQRLKTWDFAELAASNLQEVSLGLLPKNEIDKLRVILKNGFRKNQTIRQIEKNIDSSLNLKDRLKVLEGGGTQVTLSAKARALTIARTETVRLANIGLKDLYAENDIKQYRYLAALDDRTSDICNSLNGQVFNTANGIPGTNMPPMHVNCRSTIVGLVE